MRKSVATFEEISENSFKTDSSFDEFNHLDLINKQVTQKSISNDGS